MFEFAELLTAPLDETIAELKESNRSMASKALELADTVENEKDLELHKWALRCARLVSQVRQLSAESPVASLAEHDAQLLTAIKKKWSADLDEREVVTKAELLDAVDHEISVIRQQAQEAE